MGRAWWKIDSLTLDLTRKYECPSGFFEACDLLFETEQIVYMCILFSQKFLIEQRLEIKFTCIWTMKAW